MKYLVKVEEIADDRWLLSERLEVQYGDGVLYVPQDFETDLASIPRMLWNIIAPFELGLAGPVVHDWLYRHGGRILSLQHVVLADGGKGAYMRSQVTTFSRREADAVLNDLMKQDGVPAWRRLSAYRAVRLFGGSSWYRGPMSPLTQQHT